MNVKELLEQGVLDGASDIFIVAGLPVSYRVEGVITKKSEEKLQTLKSVLTDMEANKEPMTITILIGK